MKIFSALCAVVLSFAAPAAFGQELVLSNPLNVDRTQEVIEAPLRQVLDHLHLDAAQAAAIVAEDAATHQRIPDQLYSGTLDAPPDKLLLLVKLPAHGKERISFRLDPNAPKPPPLVFGREAPERKDDFAWENQQVAYRIYGPALEATGEITSGIDVWSKRVPNFVIDSFYKRDAEGQRTHNPALSYHKDNGIGIDSYEVGKSRGCGGTGVLSGGKLWVSNNYTHLKQISNGPVRFQFELTYAPWNANGVEVTETKRITLDAGTHLNKIESTFTFDGAATIDAAAGLAIHSGAVVDQLEQDHILSVWDTPQDPTAGRIATGMIEAPNQKATATQANGQALLVFPVHSGQTFTYYAGSGWSKADMPTQQAWDNYLQQSLSQLQHPLHLQWATGKIQK